MKTWLKLLIGISLIGAGVGVWLWLNRQRAQASTLQPATNTSDMLSLIAQIASTGGGTTMIVAAENKVDKEANKGLSTNDYTNDDQSKLAGIATGATANMADSQLVSRTNHTGQQAISTITNLQTSLDSKAELVSTNSEANTIATASGETSKLIIQTVGGVLGLYIYSPTANTPLQKFLTFSS